MGRFAFCVAPGDGSEVEAWVGIEWSSLAPPQLVVPVPLDGTVLDLGDAKLDGRPFASRLDDAQAEQLLRRWSEGGWRSGTLREFFENLLVEVSRRSPPRWVPVLRSLSGDDLEMLTVLRRLQGQPDPLQIEVVHDMPITVTAPGSCAITARLVNRDVEGKAFAFTDGGGYRSGRLERWNIEATDATGHPVRRADFDSWMGGGGMSMHARLAPGESRQVDLQLHHYLGAMPPGEYRLRIRYHDDVSIADEPSCEWLVTSCSAEIPLRVVPRRISLPDAERVNLRTNLEALNADAPVLILDAASAGQGLRIENPATPAERLLAAGWDAVPVLLDALNDPQLELGRRAWVLALLYDITGLLSPNLEPDAIGNATLVILGRATSNGVVVAGGGGSRTSQSGPSAEAQAKMTARWMSLRSLVAVESR
jgi:hypothetical protein